MKQKTCKICKTKFTPIRQLQPTCTDYDCMVAYANKTLKKTKLQVKKEINKKKKEFKDNDKQHLIKKAQSTFNKYIRLRDATQGCISCGYPLKSGGRQVHAGHYVAQGKSALLRFDERNVHGQCATCNTYLHGNLAEYRIRLIKKIGLKEVESLEDQRHNLKGWTIEELKNIIETYSNKIKELSIT